MNTCPATVVGTGAPGKCVLPFGTILLAQQQHPPARSTSGASHRGPEAWALLLRVSPAQGNKVPAQPFLRFTRDCLCHLQAASNERTGFISQQTLNNDILPWAGNLAGTPRPVGLLSWPFKAASRSGT